ncbi:DUF6177 family protein [Actinomyces trachealis]|uniref:DUF6177 family protein n=1 Tax=Actinomyces trachealis TaxID=2763540 RepID=UPI001892B165|nr:DUF6177 family protein [Actinomyces trachealis]
MPYPHPFFDMKVADLATVTNLDDPCAYLSEGLSDLIYSVRTTTKKQIVITIPDGARMTPVFDLVTESAGCYVLVREESGYRDARNGRWSQDIDSIVRNPNTPRTILSERRFKPQTHVPLITLSVSIYHPTRHGTVLGRAAELMCQHLMPQDTVLGWGRYEPAGAFWDRRELTKLARKNMPETFFTLAGHAQDGSVATGIMQVARTSNGLEEYLEVNLALPSLPVSEWANHVCAFLDAVSSELKPQFALAFRTFGHPDGSIPTTTRMAPTPLAILIGAPGIKQLGVDPAQIINQHGGSLTGRGRRRGILVPLDSPTVGDWSALSALVQTLEGDTGKVTRILQPANEPTLPNSQKA